MEFMNKFTHSLHIYIYYQSLDVYVFMDYYCSQISLTALSRTLYIITVTITGCILDISCIVYFYIHACVWRCTMVYTDVILYITYILIYLRCVLNVYLSSIYNFLSW